MSKIKTHVELKRDNKNANRWISIDNKVLGVVRDTVGKYEIDSYVCIDDAKIVRIEHSVVAKATQIKISKITVSEQEISPVPIFDQAIGTSLMTQYGAAVIVSRDNAHTGYTEAYIIGSDGLKRRIIGKDEMVIPIEISIYFSEL